MYLKTSVKPFEVLICLNLKIPHTSLEMVISSRLYSIHFGVQRLDVKNKFQGKIVVQDLHCYCEQNNSSVDAIATTIG